MSENTVSIKMEVGIPTPDGTKIGYKIPVTVEGFVCPHTGETILTGDALEELDRIKAHHMGLMPPEHIGELRNRMGLTQKEVSELLQLGGKTWTRWETGKARPSRSMNILLRALWDGKLDTGYLENIARNPFTPVTLNLGSFLGKLALKSASKEQAKNPMQPNKACNTCLAANEEYELAA